MSKQSVEQMLKAAGSDKALQQKIESVNGFAAAVQIGAENGYSFTEEEARAVLTEHGVLTSEGELSDKALEAVAGGWFDGNNTNVGVRTGW